MLINIKILILIIFINTINIMSAHLNLKSSQINRRLMDLKSTYETSHVRDGWIRYMRSALGITLAQLSRRVGVSLGSIAQAERNEVAGKTSLETLRKIAEAMDCELVYAMVPKGNARTIEDILQSAALKKARELITGMDIHMTLEDQKVKSGFDQRVEALAQSLIEKGDVW
jgi:predicted DNA-binding mobile mystery protein A